MGKGGATRGSVWTAVGMGVSTGCTFLANIAVVAYGTSSIFADLAVLTVATVIISGLFRLGTDRMFVGEVHQSLAANGWCASRIHGGNLLASAMIVGIVGATATAIGPISDLLQAALSHPFNDLERLLMGVWVFSDVVRFVVAEAHRADRRFISAAITSYGIRAPIFLGLILITGVFGTLDRQTVIAAAAIASVISLALGMPYVNRQYPWWKSSPLEYLRRALASHSLMLSSTFAATLIGGADVWVVGGFASGGPTASYGFAVTVVSGISILSTAINGGLSPYIARAVAEGNSGAVSLIMLRLVRITVALACVLYVGLVVIGGWIVVKIGGPHYAEATLFIGILGAGQVISTAAGLSGYVLTVARRYRLVAISTVAVAVLTMALELSLGLHWHSIIGVAIVSACGTALLPIVNNVLSWRMLAVRTDAMARAR